MKLMKNDIKTKLKFYDIQLIFIGRFKSLFNYYHCRTPRLIESIFNSLNGVNNIKK